MKKLLLLTSAMSCAALWATVPEIGNVHVTTVGRKITVSYTLSEAPAIVTAQLKLKGEALPTALLENADCNRIVRSTSPSFSIRLPSALAENGELDVQLKAYSLENPPTYAVLSLGQYAVSITPDNRTESRFYESEADIPGGIHADVYKQTRLVLRRIPAAGKTWRMGTNKNATETRRTIPRMVTLTRDYYISVFEFTCAQCYNAWGAHRTVSWLAGWEALPLYNTVFADLRGNTKGRLWPAIGESEEYAHQVDDASLIADLRLKTGLPLIDLPTSAQWEFAYRAGCPQNNYWGLDWADNARQAGSEAVAALYCWSLSSPGGAKKLITCGTLLPNAWGLYDMSGNQSEYVLDWLAFDDALSTGEDEIDPRGPAERIQPGYGSYPCRIIRGGSAVGNASGCVGTSISGNGSTTAEGATRDWYLGSFRATCPVDMSALK